MVTASSRLLRSLRLLHNRQLAVLVSPPPPPGAIIAREPFYHPPSRKWPDSVRTSDQALADNGGIFLVIEATEGQSNGVSRAHSKASGIKLVEEPTDAAIDIHADYVAKNGAPNASAPKIFFRYYYVNSSTGEKSGTMLAECKWTAADAGGEP